MIARSLIAVALIVVVGSVAHAADQTVLGNQLQVKNPSTVAKRKIVAKAKEPGTDDTIVGDPTANGAMLTVTVNGGTSSTQTLNLPTGISLRTQKPFWSGDATKGYKYKDSKGENGPVKTAQIKSAGGTFQIKVTIAGNLGLISVLPPNPGTDGCVLFEIGGGDSYSIEFVDGNITNAGATLFKIAKPTIEGPCVGAGTSTTSSSTSSSTSTTQTVNKDTTTTSSTSSTTSTTQVIAKDTTTTTSTTTSSTTTSTMLPAVFMIVMGTRDWSSISGMASAPFINTTLAGTSAFAAAYFNPPGVHPDEPNYLWLEAGTSFGVSTNFPPSINHQASTAHLVSLLDAAGISWKAYQEGISGTSCPLVDQGSYAVRHDPFVFFDDMTGTNDPNNAYCIAHVRPYSELFTDLANGTVARYNFITPNPCHDMDGPASCGGGDPIAQGDSWLSTAVPPIQASQAFLANGVLFITWDQPLTADVQIGMIVSSPLAKAGYRNSIHYTHSSTLRTIEEILNITPLLGDAANATDLSDLFVTLP